MIIGVPKEIKNHEYRVGLVPGSVRELIENGHQVLIETHAGEGSGFSDDDYRAVGATIIKTAADVYKKADMIVKVKEPQANERKMLRVGQILFTYLHLAPDPEQTKDLVKSGCVAIAYETVTDKLNRLPLLAPMSEVAGRMSLQAGAHCLEKAQGGRGVLLGGAPGVAAGDVVVIGGGVVGTNAIRMAVGMEAHVTVLDKNVYRLKELDDYFGSRLTTIYATQHSLEYYVTQADLVVTAVLVPGAAAPKLITRKLLKQMRKGAVIVDVAIDQGGACETSKPTTHADPTFVVDDIVHYCVANMPGAVSRTSSLALNNSTLPYTLRLANMGYKKALLSDPGFLNGLNVHQGKITYQAVAEALKYDYVPAESALAV